MSDIDPLRSLAAVLATSDSRSAEIIKGVVTAYSNATTPPTISVQIGGDTSVTIDGVRIIDSYAPTVGDTVLLVKQASTIFALGHTLSVPTPIPTWQTPTLGSGFTHASGDNVQYRVIDDYGSTKVQMRGACTISGTPTALWTMPVGIRPAVYRSLVISRIIGNINIGANTAVLGVNVNGTMFLDGTRTGIAAFSTSQLATGIDGGNALSELNAFESTLTSTSTQDPPTVSHKHFDGQHRHLGGNHQHPLSNVAYPAGISFHGVEYFL